MRSKRNEVRKGSKWMKSLTLSVLATSLVIPMLSVPKASAATVVTSADAMKNAQLFSAGYFTTVFVKPDGTLWGLGEPQNGDLGSAGTTTTPKRMNTEIGVKGVATNFNINMPYTVFTKSDGSVGQIGSKFSASPTGLTGVTSLSMGSTYVMAVKSNGTVWGWGTGTQGQLGNGSGGTPGVTYNATTPVQASNLSNIVQVAAGLSVSYALRSDGTLWSAGGYSTNRHVQIMSGVSYISADTFNGHLLIAKTDGSVWASGGNTHGELGDGTTTARTNFVQVKGVGGSGTLSNIVAVAAGPNTSYALSSDGRVYAWGYGFGGVLGNGSGSSTDQLTPILVSGISDVVAIQAGNIHALAMKSNGELWGWGGYRGELGLSQYTRSLVPIKLGGGIILGEGDTTPPVPATFSATPTTPTNGNVTVTITYPSDATTKQYKVGSGGTWTTYTAPVVLTDNSTVYARSSDSSGNMSAESNIVISNIDKVEPALATFSSNPSSPTSGNVLVTISYPGDAVTKEYRVNGGAWTAYSSPVSMSANGTVEARSADSLGNMSAVASYNVSNIDKTAPTAPVASVSGNKLTIVAGTDTSGIQSTEYQLNGGSWLPYTGVVTLVDGTHTIKARSIDNAGNVSSVTTISATVGDQSLSNATAAVVKAEGTKSQADFNTAQSLVSALSSSPDKDALQTRLDTLKTQMDVTAIQNELQAMETDILNGNDTKAKLDGYKARLVALIDVVEALPDTVDKDPLFVKIGYLYDLIDLITAVTTGQSIGNIEIIDIQDDVDALPNSNLKNELQNKLDQEDDVKAQSLALAISAVVKAEGTLTQANKDYAQSLVDALPNGADKQSLQDRLDAVQVKINAIAAATQKVVTAEGSKSQADVDTARTAVNALPTSQAKSDLIQRLDAIQKQMDTAKKLSDANALVALLESTYLQGDVAPAQNAVTVLPMSAEKTALQARINVVTKYLSDLASATAKVVVAEGSKKQADVDTARTSVNALPNKPGKEELLNRLNAIQAQIDQDNLADATARVVMAESSLTKEDFDKAQAAVSALPSSPEKQALQNRLDAIKGRLTLSPSDVEVLVKQAEKTKKQSDVDIARLAVNKLPSGSVQSGFHARLDAVDPALIAATNKVKQAETYLRDPYISDAEKLVNALLPSPAQTALFERIDNLHRSIEDKAYNDLLLKAQNKVKQAEQYKRDPYISDGWSLVNQLQEGADKQALVNRLLAVSGVSTQADSIQNAISLISDAQVRSTLSDVLAAIDRADRYQMDSYMVAALDKLNAIPDSIRSNPSYAVVVGLLSSRADVVKAKYYQGALDADLQNKLNQAQTAVGRYESYKTSYYKQRALDALSLLPDGVDKSQLQSRIDAVIMN